MQTPVVITCAVTGSHQEFARHPDYPITPEHIARDCIAAWKAGAAVAHVHVRDTRTGWGTNDVAYFREVVDRVRDSGSDVVLNLTTGEGAVFEQSASDPGRSTERCRIQAPEERVAHIEVLRPDMCTLDIATMNFGEFAFINTPGHLRSMARRILAAGVQPELEVFDLGQIVLARKLIDEKILTPPFLFQLCLGISYGAPATSAVMALMASMLPAGAVWSAFGVGPLEFDIAAQAVALGGHVRVGLEDNMYLSKGKFATNAQLVDRSVAIVSSLNRNIASSAEAREIFGINARARSAGVQADFTYDPEGSARE
jgi:uncharacterized protein (DUF849 family)